jgi:hypothetical protein
MRYLKKYERFVEEAQPATRPAPSEPTIAPDTKPGKPGPAPSRPSPVRRDKPSVEPAPKAKKKEATAEEVAEKFINLAKAKNIDFKKEL